jgi:hypothetical protein
VVASTYSPIHASQEAAVARCCRADPDGIFPSDLRVVDHTGKVIENHKSWFDKFRKSQEVKAASRR